MYERHWNIPRSPFAADFQPRDYVPLDGCEEACARAEWLILRGGRLGLLVGPEGSGKTLVLKTLAADRTAGRRVIRVSMAGLGSGDVALALLAAWKIGPINLTSRPWDELARRLTACRLTGTRIVLLCDDGDSIATGGWDDLLRLNRLAETHESPLTVIFASRAGAHALTTSDDGLHNEVRKPDAITLPTDLTERLDLRIDLPSWDLETTGHYLASAWALVASGPLPFNGSAIVRLTELANGSGRWTRRLADLALIAAAGAGRHDIDSDLIEQVSDELTIVRRTGSPQLA